MGVYSEKSYKWLDSDVAINYGSPSSLKPGSFVVTKETEVGGSAGFNPSDSGTLNFDDSGHAHLPYSTIGANATVTIDAIQPRRNSKRQVVELYGHVVDVSPMNAYHKEHK